MWKVLPKLGLLKFLFSVFSALFISFLILLLEPAPGESNSISWNNFGEVFKFATPVTILFISIVYFFGKWGWVWAWKLPFIGEVLNKNVCPNLNGQWVGTIESNYENDSGNRTTKDVKLSIKADMFGFVISLRSNDGYQSSKVVQSELYRDSRTGVFYISYVFEGVVPIPEESDDRLFDGAAKLEVKIDDEPVILGDCRIKQIKGGKI